jgi:leucine dehydrogenase
MFDLMSQYQLQELHYFQQGDLNAIVAINSTKLGPALGGCRFVSYENAESAATDAARLAQGMTYKAALAGVEHGGGKSVILLPEKDYDRKQLFAQFGEWINSLDGRYITAMDSGTTVADMNVIRTKTPYVASHSDIGDPSPYTAEGVFQGIKVTLEEEFNIPIEKSTVAIQGLGNVGYRLMEKLIDVGATVIVSDIDKEKTRQVINDHGVFVAPVSEVLVEPCDVLAPCGLGGVITPALVPQLNCKLIAGCANNQLITPDVGSMLMQRDILYAPDFVINSGGLIYASGKYHERSKEHIQHKLDSLTETLLSVFVRAHKEKRPTNVVAVDMAMEKLFN